MIINSTWDIAVARNACRKFVLGEKLPLTMCARAVAATAVFGEFILQSNEAGSLDFKAVPHDGKIGIDLVCSISRPDTQAPNLEALRSQLARVTVNIDVHNLESRMEITVHLERV